MTMPWSNTPPATDEEELDIDALDKLVAMEEANLVDFGTKRKALLAKRRGIFAIVMLLVGAGASAAFVSYGFVIKNREQDALFHQRANDITTSIQAAWERYEIFGLWIQESCFLPLQTDTTDTASEGGTLIHEKLRLCTRQRFRMLFDYVSSIGLNFQAAEIIVNVTDDNRHRLEESSKEFYNTQYPHVNYTGIKGFVKDNETGILSVGPQNSQPFSFPVHYAEPVAGNEAALDLDLYSHPARRKAILDAIASFKPVVTERIRLAQETDPNGKLPKLPIVYYTFCVMHKKPAPLTFPSSFFTPTQLLVSWHSIRVWPWIS